MRVPKHFDPRQPRDRRNLSAAFHSKLAEVDTRAARYSPAAMDADVAERVAGLRHELLTHPCHGCPDREDHARFAERALKLERDTEDLRKQFEKYGAVENAIIVHDARGLSKG